IEQLLVENRANPATGLVRIQVDGHLDGVVVRWPRPELTARRVTDHLPAASGDQQPMRSDVRVVTEERSSRVGGDGFEVERRAAVDDVVVVDLDQRSEIAVGRGPYLDLVGCWLVHAGVVRVRGPARSTWLGNVRPTSRSAVAAASIIASRSIPVSTPMSSTMC